MCVVWFRARHFFRCQTFSSLEECRSRIATGSAFVLVKNRREAPVRSEFRGILRLPALDVGRGEANACAARPHCAPRGAGMKWTSVLAAGLAALTTVLATGADVVAAKSTGLQAASVQESRQRSVAELRDGNGLRGYAVLNDVDGLTAMLDRGVDVDDP